MYTRWLQFDELNSVNLPGLSLTCPEGQKMLVNLYVHIVCVLGGEGLLFQTKHFEKVNCRD